MENKNNPMPNDFLEKTLEELIFTNKENLGNRGFPSLLKNTLKQFRLPSGLIIDLLSYEIDDNQNMAVKIYELKRAKINAGAVFQLLTYEAEIFQLCFSHFPNIHIENYLIGSEMDANVFLLNNGHFNLNVLLYDYKFDGLYFRPQAKYEDFTHEELCKKFNSGDTGINFVERLKKIQANSEQKPN
jgi:hypothetical protein